jgi:hypothetical protein
VSDAAPSCALARPPWEQTEDGQTRRVGVEIEFSQVDCARAGELLRELFGGRLVWSDPYRLAVCDTSLGDFHVELDVRLAHPDDDDDDAGDGDDLRTSFRRLVHEVEAELAETIGDLSSKLAPIEIAAPPIPWDRLGELEPLLDALRDAGAAGTRQSLFSAFGTQLNPEVASTRTAHLLAILRAYLLLSAWLREDIGVDLTRRVSPFIDSFPRPYADLVLAPNYKRDRGGLIDDYLDFNPTRNRELDLLPLFAELDLARVRQRLPSEKIKARPTFHYRLPDTRLDRTDWTIAEEWRRWVLVERLAADRELLAEGLERYQQHRPHLFGDDWLDHARALAERIRDDA